MNTKEFSLDGITIQVTKKRMKYLRLKVLPSDAKVSVSAPFRMSFQAIIDFVQSKLDWIKKHQAKSVSAPKNLEYIDGEKIEFLGKSYDLKIIPHEKRRPIVIENEELLLHVLPHWEREQKEHCVDAWYKLQLKTILSDFIETWEKQMNVKVHHVSIRKMKTRWGSCSHKTGRIRFSLALAKKTVEAIEYVVVHELVHLLEPSHNHRFKALMDQFMPDWRVHKHVLNSKID